VWLARMYFVGTSIMWLSDSPCLQTCMTYGLSCPMGEGRCVVCTCNSVEPGNNSDSRANKFGSSLFNDVWWFQRTGIGWVRNYVVIIDYWVVWWRCFNCIRKKWKHDRERWMGWITKGGEVDVFQDNVLKFDWKDRGKPWRCLNERRRGSVWSE
jgi:hypothetical protein